MQLGISFLYAEYRLPLFTVVLSPCLSAVQHSQSLPLGLQPQLGHEVKLVEGVLTVLSKPAPHIYPHLDMAQKVNGPATVLYSKAKWMNM